MRRLTILMALATVLLTPALALAQKAFLIDEAKMTIAITPTAGAAGTSTINGATLDMAGWDGVLIVVPFGTIVSGAATSIKAQQGLDSGCSDCADLAGSGQTVIDTADDTTFYIDLRRPLERYVRVVVLRATQAATVGGATYIQYKGRGKPATQGAGVSGEKWISPAEGSP
jgi:hypothetical protein